MPTPEFVRSGWSATSPPSHLGPPLPPWRATSWLVRLAELRRVVILIACLFMVATVGAADYLTGQDISLSIFYLIPALIAATNGFRFGLLIAATAVATGLVTDVAARTTPYSSAAVPLWNSMVRLTVLVLVIALVDALLRSAGHERQLARRDHLTGLQNSRAFYDSAETELRESGRTGRPLTLACIDIDHFKAVNDRLGHAAGDAVLIGTSRTLSFAMREVDSVARIGGDEFMLLLPETDAAEARVALGRAHRRLVEIAVAQSWDIGYSVGVVTFSSPPGSVEAMVAEADRIMYEVKQSEKGTIRYSVS
jgi:diguanylate cyclase (GGDEF)-like protein